MTIARVESAAPKLDASDATKPIVLQFKQPLRVVKGICTPTEWHRLVFHCCSRYQQSRRKWGEAQAERKRLETEAGCSAFGVSLAGRLALRCQSVGFRK